MKKGENMANKIVKSSLKHYYDESYSNGSVIKPEVDKSKSISELSSEELWRMLSRTRDELELQRIIRQLKINSGERETSDKPFEIDTNTPINKLYHDDLAHFGIKGQKWGVHRFQNEDGTRTPAGKKRDRSKDAGEDKEKSDDHKTSRSAKAKAPEGLSNDELKKLNERLQLEDTFKKLTAEKIVQGENWVKTALRDAGKSAVKDFAKGVFLGSAKLLVKEISPEFATAAFGGKEKKKD